MEGRESAITLLLLLLLFFSPSREQEFEAFLQDGFHQKTNLGVVYNVTDEQSLPPPEGVLETLRRHRIRFLRLVNPDRATLSAFSDAGIDLSLSFERLELLQDLAGSYDFSLDWAKESLLPYSSKAVISSISVGYGVLKSNPELSHLLLPAVSNLYNACQELGLKYKVTTAHSFDMIADIFPPSEARFDAAYVPYLADLVAHDEKINSTFMIDLFGFYVDQRKHFHGISSSLVKFEKTPWESSILDPATKIEYSSLFDLMLDALSSSLARIGHSRRIVTVVGIGWPSGGNLPEEMQLSAGEYNGRLAERLSRNAPSPLLCVPQMTYIYSLLNERRSSDPGSFENFWGIFSQTLKPKYRLMFDHNFGEEYYDGGGEGRRKAGAFAAAAAAAALWFNLFLLL